MLLAMLDHVKVQFVPDIHVLVPLARMATPAFIILFGAMIEIAYLSKLRSGTGIGRIRERLASRLITCWALACVLTAAAVVSGNLDVEVGLRSVFGLGLGRFNEILLIYAALFLFLIATLTVLASLGSVAILALALLGWLAQPFLAIAFPDPPYIMNFLFGVGEGYGPALLPALTLLGFGMALGETLTGRRGAWLPAAIVVLAALVCVSELSHGLLEAGRRFLAHRWINHPGYYAVGIMGFVCMAGALHLGARIRALHGPLRVLASIGTQTLFVYAAGNFALNLLPMTDLSRATGLCTAFLFLAWLIALTLTGPANRNRIFIGVPALWGRFYGKLRNYIAARLVLQLS